MKTRDERIKRLTRRREELQERINKLSLDSSVLPIRNKDFKINRLADQIKAIDLKLAELRGKVII